MNRLLTSSLLAMTLGAPALADVGIYDWTGFYIGADVGWGTAKFSLDDESQSVDASEFGILAGYNYDLGVWVVGGELGYDSGTLSEDSSSETLDYTTTRLVAKGGYEFGPTLVYGTLGWSCVSLDPGADPIDLDGVTYGIGIDYLLNANFILGADYVWDAYENIENSGVNLDYGTFRLRAAYRF